MQEIVVGFLETETAQHAAREAAALAIKIGAGLHLVTALDDPGVEIFNAFGEEFVIGDVERGERGIHNFMVGLDERPEYTLAVQIGRASCRERVCRTCRSRWSPYH